MPGITESKVARALLSGHAASIANAVLHMDDTRESIIVQLLIVLNEECNDLCKCISPTSPFQTLNVDMMANFKWNIMIDDLQIRAHSSIRYWTPTHLRVTKGMLRK